MNNIYKESRENCIDGDKEKLSRKLAAERLYVEYKTLGRYETDEATPSPDLVCNMSVLYNDPALRRRYCSEVCEIGKIDHEFSRPSSLYVSGYKLINANEELESVKNTLFTILSDGIVDEDEMKILKNIIPKQIRNVKRILNEIEIEIERRGYIKL